MDQVSSGCMLISGFVVVLRMVLLRRILLMLIQFAYRLVPLRMITVFLSFDNENLVFLEKFLAITCVVKFEID